MRSFLEHQEYQELYESLVSPVEFYMTEDTQLPNQIYAGFEVNDQQYGCSLVKSKWDGVYLLDFYRVVNVKKRTWSFKTPSDIRPCLSTILKFIEASYPFIKARMKGIIIDVPGKAGSERYTRFLDKVIKRTYISTFRSVPIVKKTEKANNFIFIVKKSIIPSTIFKSATFHKHFEFDKNKQTAISSDLLGEAEPYRVQKQNVSMVASKKYAFGKIEVQLEAGDDLIAQLDAATLAYQNGEYKDTSANEEDMYSKENVSNWPVVFVKGLSASAKENTGIFVVNEAKVVKISFAYFTSAFTHIKAREYVIGGGEFSADKFFEYAPTYIIENENVKKAFQLFMSKIDSGSLYMNVLPEQWKALTGSEISLFRDVYSSVYKDNPSSNEVKFYHAIEGPISTTIPIIASVKSNLENFTDDKDVMISSSGFKYKEGYISNESRVNSILNMPNVSSFVKRYNDKQMVDAEEKIKALKAYTNGSYRKMNSYLRDINFNGNDWPDFEQFDKSISSGHLSIYDVGDETSTRNSAINFLIKMFVNDAPKIDEAIWVYRNCRFEEAEKVNVGDETVDPGFMSTSIDPDMGNASDGGVSYKIYIPAGSRVIPCFHHMSEHPSESEVLLPPFSSIKVMQIDDYGYPNGVRCFTGVYLGSAVQSYLKLAKTKQGLS